MIVFTNAFVLAAQAAGVPASYPRIGYQTWLRGLSAADVTVSGESVDAPRDAPLRPWTDEYWQPPSLPATWKAKLGTARDIDYFGIGGHTIGSSGCAVKVETSTNDADWTLFAAEVAPGDDAALMFLDESLLGGWVRFTFTGGVVMPRISSFYAGEALAMQVPPDAGYQPPNLARETERYQKASRRGGFLPQSFRGHGLRARASYSALDEGWVRSHFDPFVREARRYPYFYAARPVDFPLEVAYVQTDEDIRPANMGTSPLMQVSWGMRGLGHE